MMNKQERIKKIKESYQERLNDIQKRREYRMQNYYDCVDDYSLGGICDKADDELENKLRAERDIMIEQVENDGHIIRNSSFYRLVSSNTGDMCNGAKCGQYGWFFAIDGRCVGVPKRLSTLTKKGYKLCKVSRTYECTLKKISDNGAQWKTMTLINESVEELDNMPEYIGELRYIDYQYEYYFK